jgi:hypothetical protein
MWDIVFQQGFGQVLYEVIRAVYTVSVDQFNPEAVLDVSQVIQG